MTVVRSLLATIGIALAALGLLLVIAPGAAQALSLTHLGVLLLGIVAILQGLRSLRARWVTPVDGADPPEPETRHETARPGDDFDERITSLATRRGRRWHGATYERVRQRLEAGAIEATAHRWRLSDADARERVATGRWTEDPTAAWFLANGDAPTPPWRTRLQAYLGSESPIAFYANRTAEAIVQLRREP